MTTLMMEELDVFQQEMDQTVDFEKALSITRSGYHFR